MCPKIDVMERECKKLEVERDLHRALVVEHGMELKRRTAENSSSANC
jgi:hypothetical protein